MILIEPPRSPAAAKRSPLNKRELAQFAQRAIDAAGIAGEVSVLLANDKRLRELNLRFRKKDAPTDVLSFPAIDWGAGAGSGRLKKRAGDLAISLETAARQAGAFGHSLDTEVKVLILHGALHLAGYDHERDKGEMARIEGRLRKEFDLPSGLIHRTLPAQAQAKKGAKKAGSGLP